MWGEGLGLEGLAVEDEAILHIAFDDAGVGLFEAVVADEFDLRDDVLFGAVVEHVLGLFHAADHGAGERAAVGDEGEGRGGDGLLGEADEAESAVEAEEAEVGVDVVGSGDAVEDEVEAAGVFGHGGSVFADDDFVGAELFGVIDFVLGRGELDDVGSHGVCELEAHVAEAAETDDAYFFVGADVPVAERGVGGDAGAEQRGDGGEVELGGDGVDVVLGGDDGVGVAAVGHFALVGLGVVGADHALDAVGLGAGFAVVADHAGFDGDADAGEVAYFEFGDGGADGGDAADDLVAGDHGVEGAAPLVADLVDVGVTDAAIVDGNDDVAGSWFATVKVKGSERRGLGLRGIAKRFHV